MGLWPLEICLLLPAYSAGIDFRRQILTTKVDPQAVSWLGLNLCLLIVGNCRF